MKKIIITLVVALGLIGAVYGAAAGLSIGGVDELGSSSTTVDSPTTASHVEVTDVKWFINDADITKIDGVSIELSESAGNLGDGSGDAFTCSVGINVADNTTNSTVAPFDLTVADSTAGKDSQDSGEKPLTTLLAAATIDTDSLTVTLACTN